MKGIRPVSTVADVKNSNGTSYILQTSNIKTMDSLKNMLGRNEESCTVLRDLPIIDGMAVKFAPKSDDLMKDLKRMGVVFTKDEKMSIPEPKEMQIGKNVAPSRLDIATPTLGLDKLHEQGITGKGVTIAVIDTGIAPHADLKDRIVGFFDLVNKKEEPYDDNKHGTHCSGIATGDGTNSQGLYVGAAPEAKLVGIKVLSGAGSGSFSTVIEGIQTAVEHKDDMGIKVLSLSLGAYASKPAQDDPVVQAVEKAVEAGVSVVIAAGNSGPYAKTVGTPGNAPNVITVGAADDKNTLTREDDIVARFSSRGPTKFDELVKPDVIAPGTNIIAASNDMEGYVSLSGTSMATPDVAGTVALLYQVKPNATPQEIKSALMGTAEHLPSMPEKDPNVEGQGMINPAAAIKRLLAKETQKTN